MIMENSSIIIGFRHTSLRHVEFNVRNVDQFDCFKLFYIFTKFIQMSTLVKINDNVKPLNILCIRVRDYMLASVMPLQLMIILIIIESKY